MFSKDNAPFQITLHSGLSNEKQTEILPLDKPNGKFYD